MNNTPASKLPVTTSTIVAVLSIALVAIWVAFAYYQGPSAMGEDDKSFLLLHPIVAILLIALLLRLRPLIGVPSVVNTLIAMIVLWMFRDRLSVLMPFILGFGLAYLSRLLLNTMQNIPMPRGKRLHLSRGYARGVLTALMLAVFGLLFLYVVPQVAQQSRQMAKGLVRFYYQSLVPFVVGDKFHALAIRPDNPDVIYLGTTQGIYRHEVGKDQPEDLTSGDLIGQPIGAVAATDKGRLYVGTAKGLYACVDLGQQRKDAISWNPIAIETFSGKSVQAIASLADDTSQLYVATDVGLYHSDNGGMTWEMIEVAELKTASSTEFSVQRIALWSKTTREIAIYITSDQAVYSSFDAGKTWSLMSRDGPEDRLIQALAAINLDGEDRLYIATSEGFYQWQRGRGWEKAVEEIPETSISLLAPFSQRILYAGSSKVLYHRASPDTEWNPVIHAEQGILSKLEDNPTLKDGVDRLEEYLTTKLPTLAQIGSEFIGQIFRGIGSVTIGFGGFLATTFFVLMVFIYASQSFMDYIWNFVNLFPKDRRDTVKLYLTEIDKNLQSYLGGQITIILIVGIISACAYGLIGVPFALLVGSLAGVCNAIPTVGPFIGGAFAVLSLLIGFAAGNFEAVGFLIRFVALFGVIFGIQAIDNSLITPKIMSSAVDIDPILLMFGVIVGGSILGFWGVLLATPIIVVIKAMLTVSRQIRAQENPSS